MCEAKRSPKKLKSLINDEEEKFFQHLKDMKCVKKHSGSLLEKAINENKKKRMLL